MAGASIPVIRQRAIGDGRIKLLILTGNALKKREYDSIFSVYGVKITYSEDVVARNDPENEAAVTALFAKQKPSPHYILRERSKLVDAVSGEIVDEHVVDHPEEAPPFLRNHAQLIVWVPHWRRVNENDEESDQILDGMEQKQYTNVLNGYLEPSFAHRRSADCLGWDHLFVNPQTGKTMQASLEDAAGKVAARHLVLADFIAAHLFYQKPVSLRYNEELHPKRGVSFEDDMSVGQFMKHSRFLSNPHIEDWGLREMRERIIDEGVFFKAGTSRPVKNYFSPPFGGIPLTPKKSEAEETIFMFHDLSHHNIPDLVCDFPTGQFDLSVWRNVYVAWRMMSEAMSLVIADMLYAATLVKTDPALRSVVDQRIFPLFEALQLVGSEEEKVKLLLHANTQYAVLGDDSAWKRLLRPGKELALENYKKHFEKFFIGDHVWTHRNFTNMWSAKATLREWIDMNGEDTFRALHVPLLSDVVTDLKEQAADLSTLSSAVPYIFEYIISHQIYPSSNSKTFLNESCEAEKGKGGALEGKGVQHNDDDDDASVEVKRRERGWRRYLLGQSSFYARFSEVLGMKERGRKFAESFRECMEPFLLTSSSPSTVRRLGGRQAAMMQSQRKVPKDVYTEYCNDVRYLWSAGVITVTTAHNYLQVHPIFPPFFINYSNQPDHTIRETLARLGYIRGRQNVRPAIGLRGSGDRGDDFEGQRSGERDSIHLGENMVTLLKEYMHNRVIFFIGYPGSGKGTQGKIIAKMLGIQHLSTGELFRAEANSGSEMGKRMNEYMQRGAIIPKELTFHYLRKELSNPKYRDGLILDGYPKNEESFHFIMRTLTELQFEPTAALYFDVSRLMVTERLCGRLHCFDCEHDYHKIFLPPRQQGVCDHCGSDGLKARPDDHPDAISARLNVFEDRTRPLLQQFKKLGLLHRLPGWLPPAEVTAQILRMLSSWRIILLTLAGSYLSRPRPPVVRERREAGAEESSVGKSVDNHDDVYDPANFIQKARSTVFHNHLDAASHTLVREIVRQVDSQNPDYQNKIYPIESLQLGPQCEDIEFASVYGRLPNFHPIRKAVDEAFTTGGMGREGFDYDQVLATLRVAERYPGRGVMTELEEDIFECEIDSQGNCKDVLDAGHTPYQIDWDQLPGWKERMIENVPKFELHHGFDILKLKRGEILERATNGETALTFWDDQEAPIDISELHQRTASGFNLGGWFIFRKEDRWAYRSNEFSNKSYGECMRRLLQQSSELRRIVQTILPGRGFTSTCSLEKVHAIWSFPAQTDLLWPRFECIGYGGISEAQVSFLVKQTEHSEVEEKSEKFSSLWKNKRAIAEGGDDAKSEHMQRTPDVVVDVITLRCCEEEGDCTRRLELLLGVVDKVRKAGVHTGSSSSSSSSPSTTRTTTTTTTSPSSTVNSQEEGEEGIRCHGYVLPAGGHYERWGRRHPRKHFENPHGSSIQALIEELKEEIGLHMRESSLYCDCIAVMDVPELSMGKHCLRIIFGILVDTQKELPKTSDEIISLTWVPLDVAIAMAEGSMNLPAAVSLRLNQSSQPIASEKDQLGFTFQHDRVLTALSKTKGYRQFITQCRKVADTFL